MKRALAWKWHVYEKLVERWKHSFEAKLITYTRLDQAMQEAFESIFGEMPELQIDHWSNSMCKAAQQEGWNIWDAGEYGWQIQKYDDPGSTGDDTIPELEDDAIAWRLVMLGTEPHHVFAREFIRQAHEEDARHREPGFEPYEEWNLMNKEMNTWHL